MEHAQRVSLSEIFEVRNEGFTAEEVLAVLAASCEELSKASGGVFSPDFVFITLQGRVQISPVAPISVPEEFIPPELRDNTTENFDGAGEKQLVWCLGTVAREASLPDCSDAGLFSLINLMTVAHVDTRPSVPKLSQMVRNRVERPEDVPKVLIGMYQEVMGDIEELVNGEPEPEVHTVVQPQPVPVVNGSASRASFERKHRRSESTCSSVASSSPAEVTPSSLKDRDEYGGARFALVAEHRAEEKAHAFDERELGNGSEIRTPPSTNNNSSLKPQIRIVKQAERVLESSFDEDSVQDSSSYERDEYGGAQLYREPARSVTSVTHEPIHEESTNPFDESDEDLPSPAPLNADEPDAAQAHVKHVEVDHRPLKEDDAPSRGRHAHAPDLPLEPVVDILPPKHKKEPTEGIHELPPSEVVSARRRASAKPDENEPVEIPQALKPRRASQDAAVSKRPAPLPPEEADSEPPPQPLLPRQNSLQPSRIQRRSTKRGAKGMSMPEFAQASPTPTRLRAQSLKRKKMTLHRVEETSVLVCFLNGQQVEVNCRSDAHVEHIFEPVVAHLNLAEHNFFGLAIHQESEYIFLENEQRLEKFAPRGWKSARRSSLNRPNYVLHLRFRYYPKKIDFVRTEPTLHQLYLQLRHDVLDGFLRLSEEKMFKLAAMAVQAEFGDRRPHISHYFQLEHYLPKSFYPEHDAARTESTIVELHSHFNGISARDMERSFIEMCQEESGYGAHFYRVHKVKPSKNGSRFAPADSYWVAVMPHGIGICREQNGARVIVTLYEWHIVRTLQFDRKRFLIATIENNVATDHVFYTDHYTKSGYLVKFAATQHRFMLKMRQWQLTLSRERIPMKDVDIDPDERLAAGHMNGHAQPKVPVDESFIQACYGSDAQKLSVVLEKRPQYGLGLTLVDGVINGVKGVYVKSVADEGSGREKGMKVGDCLLSINGVSLFNKTRHDAVNLVKSCTDEVRLEILRFPSITEVLTSEQGGIPTAPSAMKSDRRASLGADPTAKPTAIITPSSHQDERRPSRVSRTPPVVKKSASSSVLPKRQRAVSDFGAIGDALPTLNSDDLIATIAKNTRAHGASDTESSDDEGDGETRRGEYKLPVSSMYDFHGSDDESKLDGDDERPSFASERLVTPTQRRHPASAARQNQLRHGQQLDWTNELSDIEDAQPDDEAKHSSRVFTVTLRRIVGQSLGFQIATTEHCTYIKRVNADPALSCDVKERDIILAVNGQSLDGLNHEEVTQRLRTSGDVVQLRLKREASDSEPEETDDSEKTVRAVLDKSLQCPIGLSLAKRMGLDGIFIRNIASGSLADREGTLRVGDRVWKIDGENVADLSPADVVGRLKSIDGKFEVVVKRPLQSAS